MSFARYTGLFLWLVALTVAADLAKSEPISDRTPTVPLGAPIASNSPPVKVADLAKKELVEEEKTPPVKAADLAKKELVEEEKTPASEGVIFPHTATYNISLNKDSSANELDDAKGEMTITILDTGDGWAFNQKSSLMIYYASGEAEQFITTLAAWQDYAGDHYRFNYRTLRNNEEEEVIRGEAHRGAEGAPVKVTYKMPNNMEIEMPEETIFPLHHLINAIHQARQGKTVVSNVVFDGSAETQEPVRVDTIICLKKPVQLKLKILSPVPPDVTFDKLWLMSFGVYPLANDDTEKDGTKKEDSEAEYVIKQDVFNCGVTNKMTLDYGTFQVTATLSDINFFT